MSKPECLLGIDLETGGCKLTLVDSRDGHPRQRLHRIQNPLFEAVAAGSQEAVGHLIAASSDGNSSNEDPETPLCVAVETGMGSLSPSFWARAWM